MSGMADKAPVAIPLPDNYDELSDDEKDEVVAEMLRRLADATGVERHTD